jgi:beta-lactamase superfamily II metal-dependent hydrolase
MIRVKNIIQVCILVIFIAAPFSSLDIQSGYAGVINTETANDYNIFLPVVTKGSTVPSLEGEMKIHVLNVGQGDSQLLIGPTGKTLLIDIMEPSWNTNSGATWVASEIRRLTGGSHLDYVMGTHWHLDHIGYAGEGGIWSLLEQQGITADVLIDRDGGVWNDGNSDGICDPITEIVWHNAGTTSGTAEKWVCWATDPNSRGGQIREIAQLGSSTQIDLGLAEGVTVTIVQVDADGVMMKDGTTPVAGDHTDETLPPSENDYSITIWLQWGKFDYVTGGDTDGEYETSGFDYVYNDVETIVAERINQAVEAIRVNHHGSSHSTNANYVNTLDPVAAVYSVGSTNTYGHPDQDILDRLHANGTKQYFTQEGDPDRDYYDAVIVNGNVEIIVTQGLTYTVSGDVYVATDPEPSTTPSKPVLGEVVINEFLPAPQTLFTSEWIEIYNTTGVELDIGGMWIDDLIGGGQAPQQIPLGTYLLPYDYYVIDVSSYFNNDGDDVYLLGTDGATVFDTYVYSSSSYDLSYCRYPDGGVWYSGCIATREAANVH